MVDWTFLAIRYLVRSHYGYHHRWTWDTRLEGAGTEEFNNPIILSRSDGDFIDGGAAYGFWTVQASPYYRKILSIEPDSSMMDKLRRNLKLNHISNVTVESSALSDENGMTSFFSYSEGRHSSLLNEQMGEKSDQAHPVQTRTIDSLTKEHDLKPRVLKLDVEGAEVKALRGARDTIDRFSPILVVEVHHPVATSDVTQCVDSYRWTTRYRYLDERLWGFEKQAHLLGVPH